MQENFEYWLPNEEGKREKCATQSNSVIIIRANGAGKSRLGVWIEDQNSNNTHRIGAQQRLNFKENIQLKNYEEAENIVRYGRADPQSNPNKLYRWTVNGETPNTRLIDDFEPVLAALLARRTNEALEFMESCKCAQISNTDSPKVPETIVDKLYYVWNNIFPHRKLKIIDSKFFACFNGQQYPANQMSDGERSVLYLAAQVLCLPEKQTLIIDEPELHIHRSIMHPLWLALERCRPDCLFIYITHDTDFAALHNSSDKIWIQSYDGQNWQLKNLEKSDELPEELLLELLGNRRNVIFVEGEKGSYDIRLYSLLYPDYYIVPCGSCEQVISRTKAFGKSTQLHHCKVYGIIDRDYRTDSELLTYKSDSIFSIKVAELENLFLAEEVLKCVGEHLGCKSAVTDIKDQVMKRFSQAKTEQARLKVIADIKYKLSTTDISGTSDQEIDNRIQNLVNNLDFNSMKQETLAEYEDIIRNSDYYEVLAKYNNKKMSQSIGHYFSLQDKDYIASVLNFLEKDVCNGLRGAFIKYLPEDIPTTPVKTSIDK